MIKDTLVGMLAISIHLGTIVIASHTFKNPLKFLFRLSLIAIITNVVRTDTLV